MSSPKRKLTSTPTDHSAPKSSQSKRTLVQPPGHGIEAGSRNTIPRNSDNISAMDALSGVKQAVLSSEPRISPFDAIRMTNDYGQDYWLSRDLARLLGYSDYRNFISVIENAKESCKNSEHNINDHFVDVTEMIHIGKGGKRPVESVQLSRYACYLAIQNADPAKEAVAAGQTYFAVQTRRQELVDQGDEQAIEDQRRLVLRSEMREHNVQLADAAKDAGIVESKDYAIFQNHGYKGLYGGLGARDIHARKGLGKGQEILDHMGSAELAANLFRATQTEQKLRREGITGKANANRAHEEVGKKVRQTIRELGGTMPEELPTPESVRILQNRERKELKILNDIEDGKD